MAEAHTKNHDYHLVDPSPWPLTASVGAFVMAIGAVGIMRYMKGEQVHLLGMNISNPWLVFVGLAVVLYTMFSWWRDGELSEYGNLPFASRHYSLATSFFAGLISMPTAPGFVVIEGAICANKSVAFSRIQCKPFSSSLGT